MHNPWVIDSVHLVIRLLLSVLLGGLVGYERERKNHAAGLRTHTLVCLGSCLLMILSMYGFADFVGEPNVRLDPARLAAQVITGVGFLGAGTILFTGKSITGLTTAASVWVVMAVGLTVGAGFYLPAVVSAVMVLLILWGLNIVEKRYVNNRRECTFTLMLNGESPRVENIQALLNQRGVKLLKVRFVGPEDHEVSVDAKHQGMVITVVLPHREQMMALAEEFNRMAGVKSVAAE
ncbi:MgtC/SapB family protein [Cohnella cholangitidis]|uniref:MgtC/SapB family protein n=1 Tax=Cohnella cholangitidis TaxID=2598458 RepID=A0A7G5BVN7_9BACL|nr:MgtC/SapB family protein [Cohnella cholangitidis]QMV41021.1 MgtC/SapB family protein [Cohnella cholangitidis]